MGSTRRVGLRLVLVCVAATAVQAQIRPTGVVEGIVRDSTGLVLPGATVELRTLPTSTSAVVVAAAADGTFGFTAVPSGRYRLVVTCAGFEPSELSIAIDPDSRAAVTIVLRLSGLEE